MLALALSFFSFSAMFVAAVLMLDIALFRAPRRAAPGEAGGDPVARAQSKGGGPWSRIRRP
ncbi:hypothetical protein SAMN05444336_1127 [Albimonas donghaensis]|uniref:Uncharacterized protein n=1 Tax=Albimonas donghaensis TaxID=356660 RepID=A0A1H3FB74_9RHOB|nr:hypothetical protein SAMN05444336_1127 [Albimonas donghaensis]